VTAPSGFPGKSFFDAVYAGNVPWDVGAPQPDLMTFVDEHPPSGRIVDLGCGTGDLAIALARRGHSVLGVDFAPAAVEEAKRRAADLDAEARARLELRVGDALRLTMIEGPIGSVVDSGFYHLFDADVRADLVQELARVLPAGGRYYMLGFAIAIPAPDVPRQVTAEELAHLFSPDTGWIVRALRPARFQTVGFADIPAVALCAERAA